MIANLLLTNMRSIIEKQFAVVPVDPSINLAENEGVRYVIHFLTFTN